MTTATQQREMGRKHGTSNGGGNGSEGGDVADLVTREIKRIADEAGAKQQEFQARLQELEQKGARRGGDVGLSSMANGSLAEALKSDANAQAFKSGKLKSVRVPVAHFGRKGTIVSDGTTPSITPFAQNVPGIQAPLVQAPTLEDLIPHTPMTAAVIQWLREAAGGDVKAAAQTAQGALKKQGSLTFEKENSEAATAAVWMKFSKQVLDDQAGLAAYVEQRLRYGLDIGVEELLLNGTGADGQNEGLLLPANHTALDATGLATGAPMFDRIRRAKTQVRLAQGAANGLLLHPSDAEAMDLTKDAQGRYITGGPVNAAGQVWGMTPVESTEIAEGTFVVADFVRSSVFYDREDAVLALGYVDDDLTRNLLTMLLERRFAVAWNRPALIVVGTFTTTT